jgi:redox-sensing transcriptional repressor
MKDSSVMDKKERPKMEKIADSTIRRLSIYYRTLNVMEKQNIKLTTSMELAEIEGIFPAMVRKDLSYFGTFGCRGVGYDVQNLKTELATILGYNKKWGLVIIGGGQFSDVLINSQALKENNFVIKKIFDKNPESVKENDLKIKVFHIDALEKQIDLKKDHIAIIALPPPEVGAVIDRLGKIGMKAVLYLASRSIKAPENMIVMNQDITINLGMLTYKYLEKAKRPIEGPEIERALPGSSIS